MKKLTTSVLAVVLTASFALVNAQKRDTIKTQDIEGVVVTALGIKRESKALGYAAQTIGGDNLSDAGQSNAVSALSGNVAGVQVTASSSIGGSTRITMRGISSITGENRPLIVVDGVPLDNTNNNDVNTQRGAGGRDYGDATFDISPDDIESVTVLKGGPAAALYGSRAGNGAILYTTKSAKKGRTSVEFNTGVSFESISVSPKLQNEYGGGYSTILETATIGGTEYNIMEYSTDASWGPKYDQNLMYLPWYAFDPEFANDYLKPVPFVASKNDVNSFFETGTNYTNNFSISQSFNDTNVRLSYTNAQINGIVPNSKVNKDNLNLNLNTKLSEKLKVEASVNYVITRGFNRPEVGYGDNSVAQKFYHFGQRQLDYAKLKDYKLADGSQRTWNRTAYDDATPAYSDNPYWTIYENTSTDKRVRTFGSAGATYSFNDNFYAVGKVYGDNYSLENTERVAIGSAAVSGYLINKRNRSEYNYEGRLHFDKNFGELSVNSLVGGNYRDSKADRLSGNTVGGLVIPNLYNLSNSVAAAQSSNFESQLAVKSLFYYVSLGFKDMLFVETTGRNDWYSNINDPGFYPSVTGSFVFSNLLEADWLSFGKIRGGWSKIAQSSPDAFIRDTFTDVRPQFGGSPSYSNPSTNNDPNIRPELKYTKEIGLELRLFKSRVGLDVTYYDVSSKDLILPVPVDPSTGFSFTRINAGEMTNKGFEATLNLTPVKTSDFSWDVAVNFAKNTNELVTLKDDLERYVIVNAPFNVQLAADVGNTYGSIIGTDYVYDAAGNKVVDANGIYKASGLKILGSILPDYNMGIRSTWKYKNLTLSALLDIQEGGSYFSTTNMFGHYSGMLEDTGLNGNREGGILLEGVTESGAVNTKIADAQAWGESFFSGVQAQNVFDASYVKLRDLTLSYDLPKSILGNAVQGVRVSAFARNLFVWNLANKGIDPENSSYGSGNIQGLEGGSLPSTKIYGFNVNFKF